MTHSCLERNVAFSLETWSPGPLEEGAGGGRGAVSGAARSRGPGDASCWLSARCRCVALREGVRRLNTSSASVSFPPTRSLTEFSLPGVMSRGLAEVVLPNEWPGLFGGPGELLRPSLDLGSLVANCKDLPLRCSLKASGPQREAVPASAQDIWPFWRRFPLSQLCVCVWGGVVGGGEGASVGRSQGSR